MSTIQSPYERFNLVRNPFGELTRAERAELAVVDELDEWLNLLQDKRVALQFVGDCGFGKSTHLAALERRLPGAAFIYYPETGPRPALPRARPVLVDEADRMGWRSHLRLLCSEGPIVIGTHVDYSWRLRSVGFRVTTVDVAKRMTPELAARVLNLRIEASRLDARLPVPTIEIECAAQLLLRFDSNLRGIEHFLYERFQLSISERTLWPLAI